jgi:hypothetical protein
MKNFSRLVFIISLLINGSITAPAYAVNYFFDGEWAPPERHRPSYNHSPSLPVSKSEPYLEPRRTFAVPEQAVDIEPQVTNLVHDAEHRLQERLAKNYVSSHLFNLRDDYQAAATVINPFKIAAAAPSAGPNRYKVNYNLISADPYLSSHSTDINQIYPSPVSAEEWTQMGQALRAAAHVAELAPQLNQVLDKTNPVDSDPAQVATTKEIIRKRIKRLYAEAKRKTDAHEPGIISDSPIGDLALDLNANLGRCIDGLQDGLTDLEATYFNEGSPTNAGDLISRVLTDYKMEFIKKHGELVPNSHEFKTTVSQNLRQRMLYSLSLRGSEAEIAYPQLGSPTYPDLQPQAVMKRFLNGERTDLGQSGPMVTFHPYDVQTLVEQLQKARERSFLSLDGRKLLYPGLPGQKIKASFIQDIAQADAVLSESYVEFVTDADQPNAYFAKAPEGEFVTNYRVTDQFWLHLLEKYGYILRN